MDVALVKSIECPVCLDVFKRPKSLPCGHCICVECVGRANMPGGLRAVCPVCRAESQVPPTGFPDNYALAGVVEQINKAVAAAKYKCVTCSASLPPKELYVCGDCAHRVFCAHCCLDAHKLHQLTKLTNAIEQYNRERAAWRQLLTGRLTEQREGLQTGQARFEERLRRLLVHATRRDNLGDHLATDFNALVGHSRVLQTAVGDACAHEAKLNDDGALPPFAAWPIGGLRVRLNTHNARVFQYVQQLEDVTGTLTAAEDALGRLVPQPHVLIELSPPRRARMSAPRVRYSPTLVLKRYRRK